MPSVAAWSWILGAWHEAVIGLPGNAAASMTSTEGAEVIQLGRPQVHLQIAVECQLLEGSTELLDLNAKQVAVQLGVLTR